MKKVENIYLSSHFASLEEAQKTLSRDAFFLFDIHQVLFHCKGIAPFIRAFLKIQHKPLTFMQGVKALFSPHTWKALHTHYSKGNRVTEAYLNTAYPLQPLHGQLLDFSNNIYTPNKAMYQLLKVLNKEHALYLLSNIGSATLSRLKQEYPDYFELMTHAENTINSNQSEPHSLWKPQHTAYHKALRTLHASHAPHLAIFVDDKPMNCKAAQEAGMNAIRFICAHQFEQDLALVLGKAIGKTCI